MLSLLVSCLAPHLPQPVELEREVDAQLLPVSAVCRLTEIELVGGISSQRTTARVPEVTISPDARMPNLPLKLNLKPGFALDGDIRYAATVEYAERGRRDAAVLAGGHADDLEFMVQFGDAVRGGRCFVQVEVPWRRANRETGVSHLRLEYRIVGDNPDKETARHRLDSIEAQVIAYKESRFRQFNSAGIPLFGPPRGFGMMQLDTPAPTADQVWDWKRNIAAGMELFREKERIARTAPARARRKYPNATDFTPFQLKMETYQRYNGGAYWGWDDGSGEWVKVTRSRYADDCLALERSVESGNPPSEWD